MRGIFTEKGGFERLMAECIYRGIEEREIERERSLRNIYRDRRKKERERE